MKSVNKYILSTLTIVMCLMSCSKDPDVPIYDEINFSKCLRPISFKCAVEYVNVQVNFTTFPDAEAYQLEVYDSDFLLLPEGEEPSVDNLLHSAMVTEEDLPYKFVAPEEITCYIRVRAVNETANRTPSEWVTGRVKTDVDPTTRCATPSDAKFDVNYNRVTCSLSPMDNVAEYCIEVYSEAIPSSGEPNQDALIQSIVKSSDDFPFTLKDVPAGIYYWRIQGRNEAAGLSPSKWVKGKFETMNYTWLNIEGTFDYNLSSGASKETRFSPSEMAKATGEETYTWDGVTYGPSCSFYDDKWSFNRCRNWDNNTYAQPFPLECYEMIEVTQPGTISFIPRASALTEEKMPEVVIALLTTKGFVTSFDYIYQKVVVATATINTKNEENRLTVEVPEEAIYGITEPAKLYVFANLNQITVYPLKWTRK